MFLGSSRVLVYVYFVSSFTVRSIGFISISFLTSSVVFSFFSWLFVVLPWSWCLVRLGLVAVLRWLFRLEAGLLCVVVGVHVHLWNLYLRCGLAIVNAGRFLLC